MATSNPYANDNVRGEVWELGYLAGFAEPTTDHFLPYSPELLAIYKEGDQAGKDDHNTTLPDGKEWIDSLGELPEHILLHAVGEALKKIGIAAGGLISLVLTVVTIPSDTKLRTLDSDWEGPVNETMDSYVAICPRNDHGFVSEGTTVDGYWVGIERSDFQTAAADCVRHGHAEGFVARCSLADGTCGAVWPVE